MYGFQWKFADKNMEHLSTGSHAPNTAKRVEPNLEAKQMFDLVSPKLVTGSNQLIELIVGLINSLTKTWQLRFVDMSSIRNLLTQKSFFLEEVLFEI